MARFEQVAEEFWHSTRSYGVQQPLTADLVAKAEDALGLKLPRDLLALLQLQNGGCVSDPYNAFPCASNYYAFDHVPFHLLSGVAPPRAGVWLNLVETTYYVQEWGLPTPIVLLYGDGHTWVALDYRTCGPDGEPSVTWIDAEMEQELPLAPSFRSFVEGLAPTPEIVD